MQIPAQGLEVQISGQTVRAIPKVFSTGSIGWFLTGKVEITEGELAGERLQVSGNAIVVGSKSR